MPRRKSRIRTQSIGLTIPLIVLPIIAVFLFLVDYSVPFSLKTEGFEITTKSGALVVIVLWIWYARETLRHPVQTGKHSYGPAVYDPPRLGQIQKPVECPNCGVDIPP